MKPSVLLAAVLIVGGILAIAYPSFSYTTTEKAIDLGPIQVTAEKSHTVPLPPLIGGMALVCGLYLIATSSRRA